jgi:hypothetical protein
LSGEYLKNTPQLKVGKCMNENKTLHIEIQYIREILDFFSKKLVGKTLKRFEINDNIESIKKNIKELIYENYRDILDVFLAYNEGKEFVYFEFKSKPKVNKDLL